MSASRQTDGLIAVTEAGNYDPAVPTNNPGFDMYIKMAEAYGKQVAKQTIPKLNKANVSG